MKPINYAALYAEKFAAMDAETLDRELTFARAAVDEGFPETVAWAQAAEREQQRRHAAPPRSHPDAV